MSAAPSWHRLADDLTEQVRELQAKLAAAEAQVERWKSRALGAGHASDYERWEYEDGDRKQEP